MRSHLTTQIFLCFFERLIDLIKTVEETVVSPTVMILNLMFCCLFFLTVILHSILPSSLRIIWIRLYLYDLLCMPVSMASNKQYQLVTVYHAEGHRGYMAA
jgi:hypothetical protein